MQWYKDWKDLFAWYSLRTVRERDRDRPEHPTQGAGGEWDALCHIRLYNKSLIELLWGKINKQHNANS